jgi:hypothetical protein
VVQSIDFLVRVQKKEARGEEGEGRGKVREMWEACPVCEMEKQREGVTEGLRPPLSEREGGGG